MKNCIRAVVLAIAMVLPVFAVPATVAAIGLQDVEAETCRQTGGTFTGGECVDPDRTLPDTLRTVVNILLFLIGAIAVIMLIVGGLRYVLSNGDSSAISAAKNTILYAIIGIIVAFIAYAIVNFVLTSLG